MAKDHYFFIKMLATKDTIVDVLQLNNLNTMCYTKKMKQKYNMFKQSLDRVEATGWFVFSYIIIQVLYQLEETTNNTKNPSNTSL